MSNLIISLSRGRITYQLTLGLLLLNSTPTIRDALRSKSLTRLLITDNFYTTKLIRLIHLCLVLYSLLRSCKEPLTTLGLARNQYVNRTEYESIEAHSQETIENGTLTNRYKTHVQYTTKTLSTNLKHDRGLIHHKLRIKHEKRGRRHYNDQMMVRLGFFSTNLMIFSQIFKNSSQPPPWSQSVDKVPFSEP